VQVILAGQSTEGGYVASPAFPPYAFSWLRDGSFIADAMSRSGEIESTEAFFDWVARVVERGLGFDTRYTLAGEPDEGEWPRVQHDGWGLWLWAVRHQPCHDWWEEREGVHPATLACIAAGLGDDLDLSSADERLDASLLVLPFLGFGHVDIEELVSPGGGVHRHLEDTYYGGGEWLLLTALLGLADPARAAECLAWIEAHERPEGLPEQSQDHLLHPERYEPWVEKWGPPPSPLLWSHAMYLTLVAAR
jgi:GH15 family glucan-1,4-alpha-glucosidase